MISIIVPVYNAAAYLPTCLDSLLGQTYKDIEVICVDDGSQDESAFILTKYSTKDRRLKVVTQKNNGVASARNRGIAEAQGDWVMFVDSDDWVDITTCERAISLASEYNTDIILWAYTREYTNGKSAPRFLLNENKLFDEKHIQSLHRLIVGPIGAELHDPTLLHSWGTVWGKLYSRRVISRIEFIDTNIVGSAEDVLFNIEVFAHVKKAFYVNEVMYHHRKGENSFTGGYNKNLNERWKNLYTMMSEIITTYSLPPEFKEALNNRIALGLIGQGINECRSSRNMRGKIAGIKQIITQKQYRLAINDLPLRYFPPHWYLFFRAAKSKKASILYILLLTMSR
jgi:glycosyltransferase EpsH